MTFKVFDNNVNFILDISYRLEVGVFWSEENTIVNLQQLLKSKVMFDESLPNETIENLG